MFEQLTLLVVATAGLPVSGTVIAVAGVVLALVVAIAGFFVYRSGSKKGTKAVTGTGNSDWRRQPQQQGGAASGWNPQGGGNDAPPQWAQQQTQGQQQGWASPQNAPMQQQGANSWNAQNGMEQEANTLWGENRGSSPQQPAWGGGMQNQWAASGSPGTQPAPAAQEPWGQPAPQQQRNEQGNNMPLAHQAPTALGGGMGSAPSWNPQGVGQNAQNRLSDAWGPPQQQTPRNANNAAGGFENLGTVPQAPSRQRQDDFGQNGSAGQQNPFVESMPTISMQGTDKATTQDSTSSHYSDVSFPSHTIVGQVEALRVAITHKARNAWAIPLILEQPRDNTQHMEVDAHVVIEPLDFDLRGANVQKITVPLNGDSPPVLFKLMARSEGKKTIAVEFFQNAHYLGRAELETTVGQDDQILEPVLVQAALEVSPFQLSPDLTILFDRIAVGENKYQYRYRLLSPIRELNLYFEEFRSPETSITPQDFLEETFTQINRMFSSTVPGEFFFGRLNSVGMSLYRRLFSDDFKRLYWKSLRHKVKNIVLISFEPWIPWELVLPFDPETNQAEDGFLCEKFNLSRWLAGGGFPDTVSLDQLGLIVSASDLDSAKLEADEIKQLLGSKVQDILSSSASVYHMLRTNDFSGLHFACHGSFNKENPDMSMLSLEDGTWISPIDIDGEGLAFGKNKPLVFLNACETGQSGYALTGMGGWAEAFVSRAKCSGFIGAIWKANDESACKFAVAFYGHLLDGKAIAEAAKLARLSIKQAGDPTWLSYTVYANPLAHLIEARP